jgi:hypothetical protein
VHLAARPVARTTLYLGNQAVEERIEGNGSTENRPHFSDPIGELGEIEPEQAFRLVNELLHLAERRVR